MPAGDVAVAAVRWNLWRTLPTIRKTSFLPGPEMLSLTNNAPCQLFVIPDLKHRSAPPPQALVLGGKGTTEGGDGEGKGSQGRRDRVPTLSMLPRMGFD